MSLVHPTSTSGRARNYRAAKTVGYGHYVAVRNGKMFDGGDHRRERFFMVGTYRWPIPFYKPFDVKDTNMTRRWRRVPAHA